MRRRAWAVFLATVFALLPVAGCTNEPETPETREESVTESAAETEPETTTEAREKAMKPTAFEEDKYYFKDLEDAYAVQIVGRTMYVENDITMDWSGSGVRMNVRTEGETMTVSYRNTYPMVFSVYVDGQETVREICSGQSYLRIPLEAGEHLVSIIKESGVSIKPEDYSYFCWLRFGGEFLRRPEDQQYFIEVIGDSIASGDGAVGVFTPGVDYNYKDHSARASFGVVAANLLQADYSLVCRSGIGILKSRDVVGRPMPDCYDYISPWHDREHLYDFSKRRPDLIILELGANDGEFTAEEWVPALDRFVKQIRERNGNVPILWVGKSTRWYEEVKKYIAENDVPDMMAMQYSYGTSGAGSPATAKAGHPNVQEQYEFGTVVAAFIRENQLLKPRTCYVE